MKTLKKPLFTATAEQASSKEEDGSRRKRDNKSFADKLEERLIDFAVRIIKLSASLPKSAAGRHIAGQDTQVRNFTCTELWGGKRSREPRRFCPQDTSCPIGIE